MPDSDDTLNASHEATSNFYIAIQPREISDDLIQTVNGRELHEALGVGRDFSSWLKDRIEKYGFAENADYVTYPDCSPVLGSKGRGGHNRIEYALSLDMAKELAMVENNDAGRAARRYFIECERRLKAVDPMAALNDPAAMRGILLSYTEKVLELQGRVEEMTPQVQALERIAISDGSLCITDAAKTLQVQPKALFAFLRAHSWIYTRQGDGAYIAYQAKLQAGLLEHKTTIVLRSDGSEKTTTQVRVTPKGLTRLAREFPPVAQAA